MGLTNWIFFYRKKGGAGELLTKKRKGYFHRRTLGGRKQQGVLFCFLNHVNHLFFL